MGHKCNYFTNNCLSRSISEVLEVSVAIMKARYVVIAIVVTTVVTIVAIRARIETSSSIIG